MGIIGPQASAEALAAERQLENELQRLRISNVEQLAQRNLTRVQDQYQAELASLQDEEVARREANDRWLRHFTEASKRRLTTAMQDQADEANKLMLTMGLTLDQIMKSKEERMEELQKAEEEAIAAAQASGGTSDDISKRIENIKQEYAMKRRLENDIEAKKEKAEEQAAKKGHAKRLKEAKEISEAAYGDRFTLKSTIGLLNGSSREAAREALIERGIDPDSEEGKEMEGDMLSAALSSMISNFGDQLAQKGKEIAMNQSAIDTRLQGSHYGINGLFAWRDLDWKIGSAVGASPFLKQEKVVENLQTLVGKGIAFNVEQRAFLETISEKIATTFNAADATLLKLVRIQQADTTAARLGMESALTSFLNNMYATSEYMTDAAANVRQSLYEAQALMSAEEATSLEYQVQKWIGSLYSVGFSGSENLAAAFGKLAAGDISAITDGGYGNLLTMAAAEAGKSVADILEKGLTDTEANELFESMVSYLAKIYEESSGSRVVMQQYANVYGLTASDLKAAANLNESLTAVSKNTLDYQGMMGQLDSMANTMFLRTSMGEMLDNLMGNFTYTMSASMGNNPMLYLTHTIAKMLKDTTGGIDLPFLNVYGFGVDLNTTVADLMEVAAISGSVLGGLGKLVASLGSGGGLIGSGMLRTMGIGGGNAEQVTRGTGAGLSYSDQGGGTSVSESGYIGNTNSEDIKDKTVSDAAAEPEAQIAAAKEEYADVKLEQVDAHVLDIYNLLLDVSTGSKTLTVKIKGGEVPSSWTGGGWV
jgi:hypothetical protein